MKRYYIDGFTQGEKYFYSVGNFTKWELKDLEEGKVVIKNGHEFYIHWEA